MDDHAIVIADKSGTIRHWSRGAETLFGHGAADALGQKVDLIVPPEYRDQHWHGFHQAMATGTAKLDGQSTQIPVLSRDGTITMFPIALSLLRDAGKQVIGVMVIFGPRG
jgi:PAS domain S-box-containing protein